MIAEILSVGTELLMGQIANTDAQYLSRRLNELGVTIRRHTVVGDNPARLKDAIGEALARCDLLITTGGLGPTEDDLTKETVAEYFGLPLELHGDSLRAIEAFMSRIGRTMADNNCKQAYFPKGAIILPNAAGTAPGCIVEAGDKAVAVLPGPPREMKRMFEDALAPYIASRSGAHIASRFLHTFGMGESNVELLLGELFHTDNPSMALYCGPGEVLVRITARADDEAAARAMIRPLEAEVRRRLGDHIYGEGVDDTLEQEVVARLKARGAHVSAAESLTGGMIAERLVSVPGASNVLDESYVTYADASKMRILGVTHETVERCTVVSAQCAKEMAEGVRRISGADWGVSTTGYAGPDGGADGTPVGTVYIGVAGPAETVVRACRFNGDRAFIRTLAASTALNELRLRLDKS